MDTQQLLRDLAPLVLGVLVRRYRDFAGCEDAVQEALVAAARQWPSAMPDNPRAWLVRVATRRLTDQIRADAARRLREELVVAFVPAEVQIEVVAGTNERDDTLGLYFRCCHPLLSASSQIALTLRAVGGLTTAEIARAFLVPEATMAQRLSRAKQTIRGASFDEPDIARLGEVLRVLYLVFNEGYTASSGDTLVRVDLSSEAIRVTRLLALLVDAPEVKALLALMLLTDARRAARTGAHGELIPLDEQDRTRWDRAMIVEGTQLLETAFASGERGPFAIQAAIAALHDEAPSTAATDWPQIAALYTVLLAHGDNPMVRVSHAIAIGMADSPRAGLAALDAVAADPRMTNNHRVDAARAHLLERSGDLATAIDCYRRAAARTTNAPERDYLLLHAARLIGRNAP
ncbi:MAG: RNA polymerase sigma factor [Kofleriaceae bacterium]